MNDFLKTIDFTDVRRLGEKVAHYFENDATLEKNEKKHFVELKGKHFIFWTDSGVFSKKGLDFGTRTLLESFLETERSGKILDFGCGYGPIGIIIAKLSKSNVTMIDINQRSLAMAQKNALENNVQVSIKESNFYEQIEGQYDYIVTNPPIRVGKEALYQILIDAANFLKDTGELWFVIHKDQGAKSTAKNMELYYQVEVITKNKGFYIIRCRKK